MESVATLSILAFVLLFWRRWKPLAEPVIDLYYRMKMDYQNIKGKQKVIRLLGAKFGIYIPKGILYKIERIQRLSGRTNFSPAERVVIELLIAIGGIVFIQTAVQVDRGAAYIALLLLLIQPFTAMRRKAQIRQIAAREWARFVKRRLRQELHRGIPLHDALKDMGKYLPGEFGETYRQYMAQIHDRPLREVMRDLRRQYEVPELDSLCTAIEYADKHSTQTLIEMLDRQIVDEAYRLDELIESKTEAAKPKMLGMVTLSILVTVVIGGYFAYFALRYEATNNPVFWGL